MSTPAKSHSIRRVLLALAAQIPVVGVAYNWWAEALAHPLAAALLALAYEGGVLVWSILGKDVWETLKPDMVKATADWVKVAALNGVSGFRKRYKKHILFEHRVFGSKGLRTPGQGILELAQVFVELQIAPSHMLQVSSNPLAAKILPGSQPVWAFLQRFKKKEATALAILGPPGCGKTTLLKNLALTFGANRQRQHRLRAYTPVLLFLREHADRIVEQSPPLAELTQAHFSNQKRYSELDPPPHWFARHLRAGRCLVMLDGLDEVKEDQRQAVSTWVDRQIREYSRCRFILTARPQGYVDAPLARAHVLEVLPFQVEQVERFVRNWYLATIIIQSGKDDAGMRHDAERDADDLLRRLNEQPGLQELTVNPLLLTMIANVHNYRGALPKRRVELYAEICDVLLGHWRSAKGIDDELSAKQKRAVLQPLAEDMMGERTREFTTQDVLAAIEPHLKGFGLATTEAPVFLKNLQDHSGLLLENETGLWGFAHLTFQEYLCAAHWHETGKPIHWTPEQLQVCIEDDWWHEALRLYAAQTVDATSLVRTCMQIDTAEALKLAQNITNEALKVDPALREGMTKALVERSTIQLRSTPERVLEEAAPEAFGISGVPGRPLEYIQNQYEVQGDVVIDHATGLMWQKAGSENWVPYHKVQDYIKDLNVRKFAGFDSWRIPTIPELISLLEPEKQSNELYISTVFKTSGGDDFDWYWSGDFYQIKGESSPESAWSVNFGSGFVDWVSFSSNRCVRAVRS
ncbi:MAG: DUF1566 domain-containing protein [Proteobacteria bacterium]|nr:DUF1566 domain-containing protein [Pseudomonadota bacterium]